MAIGEGDQMAIQTLAAGSPDHNAPSVIATSMLVGTAALLVLGLQPILLGGLTQAGRLSEAGLGVAAMIEVLALALGATLGPRLMNRGALRLWTGVVCLLLAAVNLGVYWAPGAASLYAIRGVAGLLEGLALGAAIVVLTHTRHPDRVAGLFLAIQTIPQMVAAYLLPVLVIPRWGINSGFGLLAIVALVSALGAFGGVDRVATEAAAPDRKVAWSPAIGLFIAAVVVQNAGIGAAWNYVERLAAQHGYSASVVGMAVAGSLAFQVAGAFFVAWAGWRAPYRVALIVGAFTQAGVVLLLVSANAPGAYIAGACAFGLFWLALQPFQVQQAIALEPTRQVALLLTPLALLGLSLGPFLVSFAVRPGDVSGGFRAAAALLAAAGALYLGVLFLDKPARATTGRRQGVEAGPRGRRVGQSRPPAPK
jgi:hypothetical protein